MKQHFQIPWAQILIVCAALVMAFGMGTSVQVEQEAVGQREAFRRSLQMLDQYLCAYLRIWVIRIFLPWRLPWRMIAFRKT